MEMRLLGSSVSLGIPKTPVGVNLVSGVYIQFKINGDISTYGMAKKFTAGGKTSTIAFAQVDTNWFQIEPKLKDSPGFLNMDGKLAQLDLTGLVPAYGEIDIKLTVYDQLNSPLVSIERVSEPARGVLIAAFTIRDTLRLLPKKRK